MPACDVHDGTISTIRMAPSQLNSPFALGNVRQGCVLAGELHEFRRVGEHPDLRHGDRATTAAGGRVGSHHPPKLP